MQFLAMKRMKVVFCSRYKCMLIDLLSEEITAL